MRGRSLLKEAQSPSLCAFCAHRLGQARRPSHVQRRFIQSSRPVSKPPGEAAALREDNDALSPEAGNTWGPPAGDSSGWDRPGGIPSINLAGNWGELGSGIQAIPGQENTLNQTTSSVDLLPHEIRARELMLERTAKERQRVARNQQRKVEIPRGPGPQSSRAGRPIIFRRSEAEELELARNAAAKQKAREIHDEQERKRAAVAKGAPPSIKRYIMSDVKTPPAKEPQPQEDSSQWGQLKRRSEVATQELAKVQETAKAQELTKPEENSFERGRVQREEQAKSARYTPLGNWSAYRSQNPSIPARSSLSNEPESPRQVNYAPREEEPKFARYTPFGSKLTSDSSSRGIPARNSTSNDSEPQRRADQYNNEPSFRVRRPVQNAPYRAVEEDRSRGWGQNASFDRQSRDDTEYSRRVNINNADSHLPERDDYQRSPARLDESRYNSSSAIGKPLEAETAKVVETKKVDQDVDEYEAPKRQKKLSSRFASDSTADSDRYSKLPKGKERDKAKRRQQFAYENDEDERAEEAARARAELKKQRKREKAARKPVPILLPEYISVANLAVALRVRLEEFIEKMVELGFEDTNHNFILNAENAGLIAMEYNYDPIIDRSESEDLKAREPAPDPSILPPRPPVVTIMGHVDHGKTTILDYLRKSSVAATEHGGITQHIGAFSVPMSSGKLVTFLDTPGHAAFLSMRQRGANVTDIVILVVAADDSVKPQTIEAIKHAKAANVPIMVAINKVDKEEADINRVKQDLARHGVDVEDFGGDVQVVCVSGKTGQGMDELEEAAVALADIIDMRAEIDGLAEGWVLEASIKSMGKVATVLVRRGTMRVGDFIVAGKTWARIRCLRNEAGIEIEEAGPGTPVEIDGWREQPLAGDEVLQAPDESKAKSVVDYRLERDERDKMAEDMEAINEQRKSELEKKTREKLEAQAEAEGVAFEMPEEVVGGPKQVYFILKGDVSGSVEAVIDSIAALGNKEVQPHVLRSGVGQLSEFDIEHAAAAKGTLITFNTEVPPNIVRAAEQAKVTIINQNIIYRLVDDVKAELSKHLPPLVTQRVLGEADIAQVFSITVKGRQQKNIAGCKVRNGAIGKNSRVRVMRAGVKVFDGSIASLKNVKKDIMETKKGSECGMGFEGWFDFQEGDQVQTYEEKIEKRYL